MAQEGSISYKRLAQHFEWYASGCMTDSQVSYSSILMILKSFLFIFDIFLGKTNP